MPILRRAKVILYPADLHHALRLRTDVQIMAVKAHVDPPIVELVLYSNTFDAVLEAEESTIVPLHTVQRVDPPATPDAPPVQMFNVAWKHTSGGPGQQPWTCKKGHVLAEEGVYNYDNIEWYRPGVRPSYGCKQCKRDTVVAQPRRRVEFAEEEGGWFDLKRKHDRDWRSLPQQNGGVLTWQQVHFARFSFFRKDVAPATVEEVAETLGITTQSIRRILRFKSWRCSCSPCQRWAIDSVMHFS